MPTPQSGNVTSGVIALESTAGPENGKFVLLNGEQIWDHEVFVGCDGAGSGLWIDIWSGDPELAPATFRVDRYKLNANTAGDDAKQRPFYVPAGAWLEIQNASASVIIGCSWVVTQSTPFGKAI